MTLGHRAATRIAFIVAVVAGLSGAIAYGVATSGRDSAPGDTLEDGKAEATPRARNRAEKLARLRELASGPAEADGERAARLRAGIEAFAAVSGGSPTIAELRCAAAGPCHLRLDHGDEEKARRNNAAVIRRELVDWEGPMVSATVSSTVQDLFLIDAGLLFDGRDLVSVETARRAAETGRYPAPENTK